ncbi:hypothetical protein DFS34DRAFT_633534 [Phlyctochytrium arcticum]|nr:hypothetical protein DFS34DRAFT_633534 [Phlyctochytrium arcticum]
MSRRLVLPTIDWLIKFNHIEQVQAFLASPHQWTALRTELTHCLNAGSTVDDLVLLGLHISVIRSCIGDLLNTPRNVPTDADDDVSIISEEDDVAPFRQLNYTWRTMKVNRDTQEDKPVAAPLPPFIRERPLQYVIDLSDDSEDEISPQTKSRSNKMDGSTVAETPTPYDSATTAFSMKMKEIEHARDLLEQKMRMIAQKKRERSEKTTSHSQRPISAPASSKVILAPAVRSKTVLDTNKVPVAVPDSSPSTRPQPQPVNLPSELLPIRADTGKIPLADVTEPDRAHQNDFNPRIHLVAYGMVNARTTSSWSAIMASIFPPLQKDTHIQTTPQKPQSQKSLAYTAAIKRPRSLHPFIQIDSSWTNENSLALPSTLMKSMNTLPTNILMTSLSIEAKNQLHLSPRRFHPYRSELQENMHSRRTTVSLKLNPFLPLCRYELEGGKCFDESCRGQHLNGSTSRKPVPIIPFKESDKSDISLQPVSSIKLQSALQAVASYQGAERGEGKTRKPSTGTFKLPPPVPLFVRGLYEHFSGLSMRATRYFEEAITEQGWKRILSESPSVEQWIEYAASLLPDLTFNELQQSTVSLSKAMHALSSALPVFRDSELLWLFYLDLYCYRAKVAEARKTFQQASLFLPNSSNILWKWYLHENDHYQKMQVLELICRLGLRSHDSAAVVDSVGQAVMLLYKKEGPLSAASCLLFALTAVSEAAFLSVVFPEPQAASSFETAPFGSAFLLTALKPEQYTLLWTIYLHIKWFSCLPSNIFYSYPNHYRIDNRLYELAWESADIPESENLAVVLHTLDILNGLLFLSDTQLSDRCRKALRLNVDSLKSYVKKGLSSAPIDERLSLASLNSFIQKPIDAITWGNHDALKLLQKGDKREMSDALTKSVSLLYDAGMGNSVVDPNIGLQLFENALTIQVYSGENFQLLPDLKRSDLQQNALLWMNYIMYCVVHENAMDLENIHKAFESALKTVKSTDSRVLIWEEYLKFTSYSADKSVKYSTMTELFVRAATEFSVIRRNATFSKEDYLKIIRQDSSHGFDKILVTIFRELPEHRHELSQLLIDGGFRISINAEKVSCPDNARRFTNFLSFTG